MKSSEGGLRRGEIALAEDRQRGLEVARFGRVGDELAPVDRDLRRLDLAQPFVHALHDVLLPALHVGQVAQQLLVLAVQARDLAAQGFDLGLQIQQAAAQLRRFLALGFGIAVGGLALGFGALAQLEDGAAGLVVLEQRRGRAGTGGQAQHGQRRADGPAHGRGMEGGAAGHQR